MATIHRIFKIDFFYFINFINHAMTKKNTHTIRTHTLAHTFLQHFPASFAPRSLSARRRATSFNIHYRMTLATHAKGVDI